MIAVIRISGQVDLSEGIKSTLDRLRLRKKYTCVVLQENKEISGMLKKVSQYVAYGEIDDEMLKELIIKRGKLIGDKPIEANSVTSLISKIKSGEFGNMKRFFRLQPPKKGFNKRSRILYPKGILGNNGKDIVLLLRRML
jgi:large subunit ribosomal protein L30